MENTISHLIFASQNLVVGVDSLQYSKFIHCTFRNCVFNGIFFGHFVNCKFEGCGFTQVDFARTTTFENCTLIKPRFVGAVIQYDARINWINLKDESSIRAMFRVEDLTKMSFVSNGVPVNSGSIDDIINRNSRTPEYLRAVRDFGDEDTQPIRRIGFQPEQKKIEAQPPVRLPDIDAVKLPTVSYYRSPQSQIPAYLREDVEEFQEKGRITGTSLLPQHYRYDNWVSKKEKEQDYKRIFGYGDCAILHCSNIEELEDLE